MSAEVSWKEDGLASVTLTWPDRRNALGPDEVLELAAALGEVSTARCVVLRAQGKAFCAGGDLDAIATVARSGREAVRDAIYTAYHAAARALWSLRGVSIAAVDGGAVGLGADLALLCNVRFVGARGWLDQGWARLGLVPGTGGAWLVESIAGKGTAWDFITSSGTRWDGPMLERRGLAVAVDGSAEDAAWERAQRVARWPEETVRAYVSLLRPTAEGYAEHLERCLEHQASLLAGDAFLELAERALGRGTAKAN